MQPSEICVYSTNNSRAWHFLSICPESPGRRHGTDTEEGQGLRGQTSCLNPISTKFSVLSVDKINPNSHRDRRIKWLNACQVLYSISLHTVSVRRMINAWITIGRRETSLVYVSEVLPGLKNISKLRKNIYFTLGAVPFPTSTNTVSFQLMEMKNNCWMWWWESYNPSMWEAGRSSRPVSVTWSNTCLPRIYETLSPRNPK